MGGEQKDSGVFPIDGSEQAADGFVVAELSETNE